MAMHRASNDLIVSIDWGLEIGLLQQTITLYMVVGKLIIIPALGHQNKGKSSFTGSGLFVLMSQCRNNMSLPTTMYHVIVCCKRPIEMWL